MLFCKTSPHFLACPHFPAKYIKNHETSFKIFLLTLAVISAGVLWQQQRLAALALTRIDPLPLTRAMLTEKRYAEAQDYLDFFINYDYIKKNPEAQSLHQEISARRSNFKYKLKKIWEGFQTGTSDETIGKTAGVVSDFFVIGDIRDLAVQGVRLARGEEVDETLVALASLGVVATAAQVTSGAGAVASGGISTPAIAGSTIAKSGLIALKAAKKLGRLPSWLNETILQSAKFAKESKNLDTLTSVLGDVNALAKVRGGFQLMSQTENSAELHRMAKFTDSFGEKSATMYRLGGNTLVGIAQHPEKFDEGTVKLAATYGQSGLKLLNNVGSKDFHKILKYTKITYKGDIFRILANFLLKIPTWLLFSFIILGLNILIPWRKFTGVTQDDQALQNGKLSPSNQTRPG